MVWSIFAKPELPEYKSLMQILHQINQDFKAYLIEQVFEREPIELYHPISYVLSIGGKRLRPAILLLSCYLFEDKYEKALPAALAIEIFHNFTLIHDDIMDNAPLRRGMQTVHEKFGLNSGILSGDVMLVLAYKYLMEQKDSLLLSKILKVFNRLAIGVCEGQQMDMNFEKRELVSIEEYLRMIELKTSVLVAGALEIGAILGGANQKEASTLYQFGRNLGIAFQLQDDLLDTYGDPEKFGKKVGGDIAQNKKTILYLKALEIARPVQKEKLSWLFHSSQIEESQKITGVVEIFDELGVREHATTLQEAYKAEAFRNLDLLNIGDEKMKVIKTFAQNLMIRDA